MSKRTRKKQSEDRVEAIVREILPPDVEIVAVGGRPPDDSVEELGEALDALDAGRAGVDAEAEGQAERQGWADHVDPAGLASEDDAEFAGGEREVVI
nr:hypothetical protein [Acidobacteriota bacterium]